jgi:hypothetical protein
VKYWQANIRTLGHSVLDAVVRTAVTLADGTLDLVSSRGERFILVGLDVEVDGGRVLAGGSVNEEGGLTERLTTIRLRGDNEDGSSSGTRVVQHLEVHADGNQITCDKTERAREQKTVDKGAAGKAENKKIKSERERSERTALGRGRAGGDGEDLGLNTGSGGADVEGHADPDGIRILTRVVEKLR